MFVMKKFIVLLLMAGIVAPTLTSCRKRSGEKESDVKIVFEYDNCIVDYTSMTLTVGYESNVDVSLFEIPSWCSLVELGPDSFTVSVERNESSEQRSGNVVLGADTKATSFVLTQRGKEIGGDGMVKRPENLYMGKNGGHIYLDLVYEGENLTQSVEEGVSWLTMPDVRSFSSSRLQVVVDTNPDAEMRRGVIYFVSDAGVKDSTVIWQMGDANIYFTDKLTYTTEYLHAKVDFSVSTGSMPAGDVIEELGYCYSTTNLFPDRENDRHFSVSMSGNPSASNVSYSFTSQPVYRMFVPGKTYNIRYYMKTDKNTYYSDTKQMKIRENAVESDAVIKIPVVFHLYYSNSNPSQNISKEIIEDALDMANYIWRGRFGYGSVDTGVELVPATTTPWGETLPEAGIHRVAVSSPVKIKQQDFVNNQEFTNSFNLWDTKKYLNVWIADVVESGVAGFSFIPFISKETTLPGLTASDYYLTHPLDFPFGIVLDNEILYSGIACNTLGHELGHVYGLYHPFSTEGCVDSDYCSDTPTYNRTSYEQLLNSDYESCVDGSRVACDGTVFISENFMDYFISQQIVITEQQKERIDHVLKYGVLNVNLETKTKSGYIPADDRVKPQIVTME